MEQTSLGRQSGGGARPVKSGTGFPTSAHYQLRGGASVSPSSEDDADRGGVWSGTVPATTEGRTKLVCPVHPNLRQPTCTRRRKLALCAYHGGTGPCLAPALP
ncbi:uncharacterized protein LOC123509357 [Portunus trituberculatus]|uniref:uncharacterized protein LOC123509357 n=1 Tax=Portunus trituberculatus TaxID=210409 RepID=UPI001E1CED1E|nr:uncharacterized protein LOC123509357 [Portunus trituberculatus]XP_045119557.1 uncharacterized protein LOC123509357 [Portunus trituberculatus]